jgi:hypothetical protein
MAFLMVPPPQITPRMPRERGGNFLDLNVGNDSNNNAIMLAVLQMMMQQKGDEGRLALERTIANSQIESQGQQRELMKMQMSAMARESGLRPANEVLLKRQALTKAALDEDKMKASKDLTNELTVSASQSPGGKALKKFSANYNSIGYGDGEAREMLGKLQTSYMREINNAKSTAEQIGIATAYQNGLQTFINTPGVSEGVRKKAALEFEGLSPHFSVLTSPSVQNQFVNETLANMDRDYQTEWTNRMTPAQERVEETWQDQNLSTEMKVAKAGKILQEAAANFPRMKRRDASLASMPQEPETVSTPPGPTTGTMFERALQSAEKSTVGQLYQTPGERTGPDVSPVSQTPLTEAFHDFFLTPDRNVITSPIKNLGTGLKFYWDALFGGSDPKEEKAKAGLSGYDRASITPAPAVVEEYTEDGWLKTPVKESGDYDFLWNP